MKNFFIIKEAVNTKETGNTYPQVILHNNYDFKASNSVHNLSYNSLPSFKPNLNYFILDKKANLTDLISQVAISAYGLLVSQKFKKILNKYNIINHLWFEASVVDNDSSIHKYYLLQLEGNSEYLKWVDFKNSNFIIKKGLKNLGDIQINSSEDFFRIKKSKSHLEVIKCKKLYLNSNFDNSLDLFLIPFINGKIYISKNIKEDINNSGLTGIEIKDTDLSFY